MAVLGAKHLIFLTKSLEIRQKCITLQTIMREMRLL